MKFEIPGEMIDFNTYLDENRNSKFSGANLKKAETEQVHWLAKQLSPTSLPVFITFTWIVKNKRKDKDNIAFAKKMILDGLVAAGIIKSDGFDFIAGFADFFHVDPKNPRVLVEIEEISYV